MLNLTKKVDYGLIALTHLALSPGGVASAREIAERYNISTALLSNILKRLAHHGFVASVRGVKGGYSLRSEPRALRLSQVVSVLEGDLKLTECIGQDPGGTITCQQHPHCLVRGTLMGVHRRLEAVLEEITLGDLVADARLALAAQTVQPLLAIGKARG